MIKGIETPMKSDIFPYIGLYNICVYIYIYIIDMMILIIPNIHSSITKTHYSDIGQYGRYLAVSWPILQPCMHISVEVCQVSLYIRLCTAGSLYLKVHLDLDHGPSGVTHSMTYTYQIENFSGPFFLMLLLCCYHPCQKCS